MTPITAALRELAAKATPVTDGCDDDPKHLHLALSPDTLNQLLDVVEAAEDVSRQASPKRDAALRSALAALEADHAV